MKAIDLVINKFLLANSEKVLLGVAVISVLTFIVFFIVSIKLSKMTKRYNELTKGVNGENLEDMLINYADSVNDVKTEIAELREKQDLLKEELSFTVSKVSAKRYNAFADMGSDLSFSIALLNKKDAGVLITSIYGRDENRVFLKPVKDGRCDYPLSPEEKQVLEKALCS